MKKSNFLKSSKDMLHRSFNPSKCKTSLRLAGSRLKLLRNKKEVQVNQMKREIAQLLDSGQDQTARIRVEHVIREEKMMTAYDLIELYCELIVARLPIIETQKICPIDLKEAITSVVFASPRCGDVPELIDIKKHFTEKYGKEFITAAVELRPGSGVSRLLVEKLSAVAPDGQTKIKTLSKIAEEHNVKWDPKSFSESSMPASDLLNGPSTFGEESKLHTEPSYFEGSVHQVPQSNNRVHDSPSNLTQVDNRTSREEEKLASTKISGTNQSFQHKARPPDDERAQLFQGDNNTLPRDRQRWNMEFKDATSAAQAAAESAELASMAARAAAELSSGGRIVRQYSTESHYSDNDGYMNSRFSSGQSFEESKNRSYPENTRSQNEQIDRMQPNNRKNDGSFKNTSRDGRKESTQSASLKSQASIDNNSLDHHVSRGGTSMQRESFKYKAEKPENVRSSNSHTSISNDVNIFSNSEDQNYEYGAGEDSFSGFGKKGTYEDASQMDTRESADADLFFDKFESESENQGFNTSPIYDEPKERLHVPLSGQKPHDWSPRSSTSKTVESSSSPFLTRKSSSTDFSERSSNHDDPGPVVFDQSDAPTSESDEDMNVSRHPRISGDFHSTLNQSTSESEEEMNISRHPRTSTDFLRTQNQSAGSQFKDKNEFSIGSSLKERSPQSSLSKSDETEIEGGLNLQKLTGGLRHKGYNHPPYLKNRFDVSSSSKKESEENTTTTPKSAAVESPRIIERKNPRMPYLQSDSDSDNSVEEESLRKIPDHKQERYAPTIRKNANTKPSLAASTSVFESPRIIAHKNLKTPYLQSESDSDNSEEEESSRKIPDPKKDRYAPTIRTNAKTKPSLAASASVFGSGNSDSDEDRPSESISRYRHQGSGISRRTKAVPSSSGKINNSQMQQNRLETIDSDDDMDRKATNSTISEIGKRSESTSNRLEHSKQPTFRKEASKPIKEKQSPESKQESKVTLKSSSVEESSMHQKKTGASISRENPKVVTLEKTSSNKDGSNQSSSHVHPKLPDYDDFVQLFQKNRP